MDALAGDTAIETRAAAPTVSVVEFEIEPMVAVIVVAPVPALEAKPFVPVALLTTATVAKDELHVTVVVRF